MKELWALPSIFSMRRSYYSTIIRALAEEYGVSLDTPYGELPEEYRHDLLVYGTGGRKIEYYYESRNGGIKTHRRQSYEGIVNNLERRYR